MRQIASNNGRYHFSGLFFILLVLFPFLTRGQAQNRADTIIILHTNDMHAKIDIMGRLAYLADSLERSYTHVFLIAAGDNFTGNPVVDMVKDKGYPMIDLMNRCGFRVSTVGNHEFDLGQDLLRRRIRQAKFPFISCNINTSGTRLKQFKPYVILKAGKIKIPILGIIQLGSNGLPDSHPSRMTGLTFTNGIKTAEKYTWLKERYGSLIALSHLGVDTDRVLARQVPQADLIIGGHSHTILEKPITANGVMIVQAGANLQWVGKATLIFSGDRITSIRDTLIALKTLTRSDPKIQARIDKYNKNKEFDKVVGTAAQALTGKDELGSLMTDAITEELGVDFAFLNNGGIRIGALQKGDITLKDIYRLDPFGNQLVISKMNAEDIRVLICNAYNMANKTDLQVSGMTYTVYPGKNARCDSVSMKDRNGNALQAGKIYTVGMNSYMAASYSFPNSTSGSYRTLTTAQALIQYLEKVRTVNYQGVKRAFP